MVVRFVSQYLEELLLGAGVVTYSYESTIRLDQSEQNAFPQTAAGEASSVVETEGQVTLTSPSTVPPNRDTDT